MRLFLFRRASGASSHPPRRGLTLVELLVVVGVIAILMSISIPLLKNSLEGRKIREASRQISVFFEMAKSRAAQAERPIGVWIEATGPAGTWPATLFLAESPPAYGGDLVGAKAQVAINPPDAYGRITGIAHFPLTENASLPTFVKKGDLLRFNYRGSLYVIDGVYSVTRTIGMRNVAFVDITFCNHFAALGATGATNNGCEIGYDPGAPPPLAGTYQPYQLFRQPERNNLETLQLPEGVVIDMGNSGWGPEKRGFSQFGNNQSSDAFPNPLLVVFSPEGHVLWINAAGTIVRPTSMIHFLIGEGDKVGDTLAMPYSDSNDDVYNYNENLTDNANLWISINPRSGAVSVAENAWSDEPSANQETSGPFYFSPSIRAAREFAQSAQSTGGQ